MNIDYKDSLRDLGLTEGQIESILDLNSEALYSSMSHAYNTFEQMGSQRDNDLDHYALYQETFLQTERFIY